MEGFGGGRYPDGAESFRSLASEWEAVAKAEKAPEAGETRRVAEKRLIAAAVVTGWYLREKRVGEAIAVLLLASPEYRKKILDRKFRVGLPGRIKPNTQLKG